MNRNKKLQFLSELVKEKEKNRAKKRSFPELYSRNKSKSLRNFVSF